MVMKLRKLIMEILHQEFNNDEPTVRLDDKYIDELTTEISKYKSSEELLRGGGLPIEMLETCTWVF